jgi:hypothetical protein
MKKSRVVEFASKDRILKKPRSYVESVETFLAERDLKHEIMMLPGSFAKEAVVWPMFDLLMPWRAWGR